MHHRNMRTTLRGFTAARRVVLAWRLLTGCDRIKGFGRSTLVACSGGADSCALALALWSARVPMALAHIVHDMRPREQAMADRDAACALASLLHTPFVEAEVAGLQSGGRNIEAAARQARYRELAGLARAHGCEYIATAHHADDQAETLLLRLLRGSGVRGLAGIRASVAYADRTIIRPMLGITRAQSEQICGVAGWNFVIDSTNADTARARGWLRHEITPRLDARFPGWSGRAASMAEDMAIAASLLGERADALWRLSSETTAGRSWSRAELRGADRLALSDLLRLCAKRLVGGRGLDRAPRREQTCVIAAIQDDATHPRTFRLGRLRVAVTAKLVEIEPAEG